MRYMSPTITDFGSISAHTFLTPGGETKNKEELPGHIDQNHLECSGVSPGDPANCNVPD